MTLEGILKFFRTLLLATLVIHVNLSHSQSAKPKIPSQSPGSANLVCKKISGDVVDVWAAKVPFDCDEFSSCSVSDDSFVMETAQAYMSNRVIISRVSGVATIGYCSTGLDIDGKVASTAETAKKAIEYCRTRWRNTGQMQCEKGTRKF